MGGQYKGNCFIGIVQPWLLPAGRGSTLSLSVGGQISIIFFHDNKIFGQQYFYYHGIHHSFTLQTEDVIEVLTNPKKVGVSQIVSPSLNLRKLFVY